jgi:MFS family permease
MFLTAESFARDPIIPIPVLRSRGVLLSCLSQLGFMASRWTVLFYAPIFVLAVRGLPPAVAGAILLPTNLGFGLGSVVVGALHIRRAGSFWLPAWVSLLLFSTTLFTLAFVSNAAAPPALYIAIVFLNGLCTGAALNYTLSHLLHVSSPDTHYIVTSLLSTFRGFAGSFGTAIGGGIFSRTLRDVLTEGFKRLDGGGDGGLDRARQKLITVLIGSPAAVYQDGVLNAAERLVAVQGYERALEVLYKSAAAACVLVVVLQVCTGWTAPPGEREDDEGEIEEAVAEHDGTMEA